jgi:hypothetical protein
MTSVGKTTVQLKHTWKDQIQVLGHRACGVIRISRREGHAMYSNLFRVRRTLLEVHGQKGRWRRPDFSTF